MTKKKKIVVPRPQSERKRSNKAFRYEPSSFDGKKRKLASISLVNTPVDEVKLSDDDDFVEEEEDDDDEPVVTKSSALSTEFSKSKLTPEMKET